MSLSTAEREPLAVRAGVTAAVTAVVHTAVVLGVLHLDAIQETAIGAAVDAVGLVVILVWVRSGVTANAKVIARVTTAGGVVAGDAAVTPTGTPLETGGTTGSRIIEPVVVKSELVAGTRGH